ncbi:MAG: 5-formyltetrahydrofolate cyclo-ligase [Actinomycetota bacterium]
MSADLKREKRRLRAEVLARRDALPQGERDERSRRVAERLTALPDLAGVEVLMAYWPFGSEVDPRPFLAALRDVRVALPRVVGSRLVPVAFRPGDALRRTPLGPSEPVHGEPLDPASIGFVLVPGVAFDRSGARLGYGGGFYDRFVPALAPGTPLVAAAFACQVVEGVPSGTADHGVDVVVTEDEVLRAEPR